MHLTKKIAILATAVVILTQTLFYSFNYMVSAQSLEDQLEEVEARLRDIQGDRRTLENQIGEFNSQISGYAGELGKLQAEVEQFDLEVQELELQIEELDLSIKLLTQQIEDKEKIITERLDNITDLEDITYQRIRSAYADYRLNKTQNDNVFAAEDINEYFKSLQYKQLIQSRTNKVLEEVVTEKLQLEYDREQLNKQKIQLAQDKAIIEERRRELDEKKKELQSKMDKYFSAIYGLQNEVSERSSLVSELIERQARAEGEREYIRQQIFDQFDSIPSGQYVTAGTQIGRQGATGLATGPHVHFLVKHNGQYVNPCVVVPAGRFGNCAGNGAVRWPLSGTFYYTSPYGNRCIASLGYCSFHSAIDIAHPTSNAPVYAAHSGWLSKGVDQYGALYTIICQNQNCNSGLKTGYWHLSSY